MRIFLYESLMKPRFATTGHKIMFKPSYKVLRVKQVCVLSCSFKFSVFNFGFVLCKSSLYFHHCCFA
ncbi:MAG: hypothetical protein COB69_05245 [Phycisphaera sp.]|nr:MAG: hypothetical protein COB69_05245 [Phycisphaera sp.]